MRHEAYRGVPIRVPDPLVLPPPPPAEPARALVWPRPVGPPWPHDVECFLAPEAGKVALLLRRYTRLNGKGWTCEAGWHEAAVPIGEEAEFRVPCSAHENCGMVRGNHHHPSEYAGDPRWPSTCAKCSYPFADTDEWQVFTEALHRLPDGSEVWHRNLPAGALFDSWWMPEGWKTGGEALTLVLPDLRPWNMDGPASSGGRWTRTGTPPKVTARPSILSGEGPTAYHGWLTSGVLTLC